MKKETIVKESPHQLLTSNRSHYLLLLISFMLLAAVIFPAVSSIASRQSVQDNTGHVGEFTAGQAMRSLEKLQSQGHSSPVTATDRVNSAAGINLLVNTLGDAADSNVGDGHCDTDGNSS